MSTSPQLKHEPQLRQLASDIVRDGLPVPHRPEATMALAVAIRDALGDQTQTQRAAAAAALALRVFDATLRKLPPAARGAELACKAGCTYCCHNVVMATAPEIFLLAGELRARHDAGFVAGVAGRCDAVAATAGVRRNPCPLLHDDLCSVYEGRPSVCRKHNSLAVDACIADYEGRGGTIPIRRFDQEVFECCAVALLLGQRLWGGRPGAVHELAGALRVVLAEPEAEQRWLAGEPVFAGVHGQSKLPGIDEHAAFLWSRFVGP
jgi:Fe-S-cluster containining protein